MSPLPWQKIVVGKSVKSTLKQVKFFSSSSQNFRFSWFLSFMSRVLVISLACLSFMAVRMENCFRVLVGEVEKL